MLIYILHLILLRVDGITVGTCWIFRGANLLRYRSLVVPFDGYGTQIGLVWLVEALRLLGVGVVGNYVNAIPYKITVIVT